MTLWDLLNAVSYTRTEHIFVKFRKPFTKCEQEPPNYVWACFAYSNPRSNNMSLPSAQWQM